MATTQPLDHASTQTGVRFTEDYTQTTPTLFSPPPQPASSIDTIPSGDLTITTQPGTSRTDMSAVEEKPAALLQATHASTGTMSSAPVGFAPVPVSSYRGNDETEQRHTPPAVTPYNQLSLPSNLPLANMFSATTQILAQWQVLCRRSRLPAPRRAITAVDAMKRYGPYHPLRVEIAWLLMVLHRM